LRSADFALRDPSHPIHAQGIELHKKPLPRMRSAKSHAITSDHKAPKEKNRSDAVQQDVVN